jgi:hypothetical protein
MNPVEPDLEKTLQEHGFDVILASPRDRRTLAYLFEVCGVVRVKRAHADLKGRLAFVSTLSKILGVTIPDHVIATPQCEGRTEIGKIKEDLKNRLAR